MSGSVGIPSPWQRLFALVYLLAAGLAAWQTIQHTNAAANYFDQICDRQNLRNEGAQIAGQFAAQHSVVGPFIVSYLRKKIALPSLTESTHALGEVPLLQQGEDREGGLAASWSWILLGWSLFYLALSAIRPKPERGRSVLFALTAISAIFFVIGISASVMMVFTSIDKFFGTVPVIQHEVRSVFSVITGLFSTGHWIFAGYITLFSIGTPAVKIALTFFGTLSPSSSTTSKISRFLNVIDKWSMTDVFVAAILLACFTIKSGEGTQVVPCRGLYYFAGYCLLSMITTSLLDKLSFDKADAPAGPQGRFGIPILGKLVGVVVFLSAIYTLRK